jgi:hypothetical protein
MSSRCDVGQYCVCINFQEKLSISNVSYRLIRSLIWYFGSYSGLVSANMFISYIDSSHSLSFLDIFCSFTSVPHLFPCYFYLVFSVTFLTLDSCPISLSSLIVFPLSPYYMVVHFICSSYLLSPSWISFLDTNSRYSVMHICCRAVGLRQLACWNSWFESRRRNACVSLVNVVCFQMSLRRADTSSRGILLSVVYLSVISKPQKWGDLGPGRAVAPQIKRSLLPCYVKIWYDV